MSLTDRTIAGSYIDVLQMDNTNSGVSTSLQVVKDGGGSLSSLQISDDNTRIQPRVDDTSTAFEVMSQGGVSKLSVDTSNNAVKALGHNVNTQYANFGIFADNNAAYVANTHYAITVNGFGIKGGGANIDFGTGTDPDDTFTTADTATQYASQLACLVWFVTDNITIDSVTHIEGADAATGDTTRMHLKSFTFTSGATACLTAGALLAHNSDITNAGNEQPYLSTWTVDSADVDANKVILCFFRSDSVNSDYTLNVTVKYHLR